MLAYIPYMDPMGRGKFSLHEPLPRLLLPWRQVSYWASPSVTRNKLWPYSEDVDDVDDVDDVVGVVVVVVDDDDD